ncbi:MAG: four helix bundle protein [Candidatus Acidiferrales bacterium]
MSDAKASIASYRGLAVWQKGMDLVVSSYKLARRLPASETYGLAIQIQRAAVSVPANIAEGYDRHHVGDYLHHVSIAKGSQKELETHLLIAQRPSYLREDQIELALALAAQDGQMLRGLAQGLRKKQV